VTAAGAQTWAARPNVETNGERGNARDVGQMGTCGQGYGVNKPRGTFAGRVLAPQARPEPATLPYNNRFTAPPESYPLPLQPLPSTPTARLTPVVLLLERRQPCLTPGMRTTPANTPAPVTHRRKMHPEMRHKYPLLAVVPALFSTTCLYVRKMDPTLPPMRHKPPRQPIDYPGASSAVP
jgi:hypothetical protein